MLYNDISISSMDEFVRSREGDDRGDQVELSEG